MEKEKRVRTQAGHKYGGDMVKEGKVVTDDLISGWRNSGIADCDHIEGLKVVY